MTAVLVSESCRPVVRILGVPVDATDLPRAVASIKRWGERKSPGGFSSRCSRCHAICSNARAYANA